MNKIEKAFELFDAYNQQDPNHILWEGITYPSEYFYALQLYNWVKKLAPGASEVLLLASRSQHICRWQIPRTDYPEGKAAYYKWRTNLAKFHAEKAGELLKLAGYEDDVISGVQRIIRKEHIKTDEDVQIMEDALCLVFLQFQYEDFITKHDDQKVIRILQRTWAKMSHAGKDAAFTLRYNGRANNLLEQALIHS